MKNRHGKIAKLPVLDEGLEELIENQHLRFSPVDLADEINKMLDEKPLSKSPFYKEWKNKVNLLIINYNSLAGWKAFVTQ